MNDLLISSNMFLCWNYNELEHVFEQHYDPNYMVEQLYDPNYMVSLNMHCP